MTNSLKLLTTKDVASLLALSPYTVRQMANRLEIPHVRLGRQIRFEEVDVRGYIEGRRVGQWRERPIMAQSGV